MLKMKNWEKLLAFEFINFDTKKEIESIICTCIDIKGANILHTTSVSIYEFCAPIHVSLTVSLPSLYLHDMIYGRSLVEIEI